MIPVRVLPHNLEAEMSVLGAILQDGQALMTCCELLCYEDFYRLGHGKIFAAVKAQAERSEPVDLITATNELRQRNELEEVGGASFLAALVCAVPTAANISYHAKIVKEKSLERHVIKQALRIADSAWSGNGWRDTLAELTTFAKEIAADHQGSRQDLSAGVEAFLGPSPQLDWDIEGVRLRRDHGWTGGAPKGMKGLFSLEEARAESTGTPFLGHFPTRRARVLYGSEEDRVERLHRRVNAMLAGRPTEEIPGPEDLRFLIKAGIRLDTQEGLRILSYYLELWRPEVVFLEHFDKLHSKNPNAPENMKPLLDELDQLHTEFGCVFRIQKHHRKEGMGQSKRKGEMLSGTQALFGWGESSVSLTLLRRGVARVDCEAKDGETAEAFLIEYRNGRMEYAGPVKVSKVEENREKVLEYLEEHPDATTAEIGEKIGKGRTTVATLLTAMERDEMVVFTQETEQAKRRWRCK